MQWVIVQVVGGPRVFLAGAENSRKCAESYALPSNKEATIMCWLCGLRTRENCWGIRVELIM